VQISVELATPDDRQTLRTRGLAAMRQARLARLCRQAQVQGGLLTVEDLAYLTCSSTATVKRTWPPAGRRGRRCPPGP
jgi:hypothetical protein